MATKVFQIALTDNQIDTINAGKAPGLMNAVVQLMLPAQDFTETIQHVQHALDLDLWKAAWNIPADNLEDVFIIGNYMAVRPDPYKLHKRAQSVSVGNIAVNDNGVFHCSSFGWTPLEGELADTFREMAATV